MRRQLSIIMLAITGWCLAAGLFLGRAFNPNPKPPAPEPDLASTTQPLASTTQPLASPKTPPPLLQWTRADPAANTLPDPSGRGFDARLCGTARILPAWEGTLALSFDGSGDNTCWTGQPQNCGIAIPKHLPQAFQSLSVEAWIRKHPAGWMPILYRDRWDDENGFGLYMEWSQGKAAFGHYGNESAVQSNQVVQDGLWHHIVGTLGPNGDGTYRYRLYVDGNLDAQQSGPWAVAESPPSAGILMIACPNNTGNEQPYKGDLGPLALFDTELTPDQIQSRYNAQKPH